MGSAAALATGEREAIATAQDDTSTTVALADTIASSAENTGDCQTAAVVLRPDHALYPKESSLFPFPGHDAPTRRGRNLFAAAFLDSMFTHTRLKQRERTASSCTASTTWWASCLCVALYFPIGLVLLILRVGIFFPLGGLMHVVTPSFMHTGMFRCVACCCFGNVYHYRHIRRQQGMCDEENGDDRDEEPPLPPARIIVANHTTEMDVLPIRARGSIRIMGYDMYTRMCWLQYSPLRFLDMLYIKQTERSAGGGKDRDAVREQVKTGLAEPGSPPLLVFPEGGLTSGRRGLLQFHKFLFSLGHVVQPVSIQAHGGPLPINIDNNMGTTWGNILAFTFQPWQHFTVTYLPPQKIRAGETPLQFAHRVMRLIAVHTGDITASPFLYRDKRIYTKMKARLYKEGFTYRFVGESGNGNPKRGRVLPEVAVTQDEPQVVVTRTCCGCGKAPNWEGREDGIVSPADYLARAVEEAWTAEDGGPMGSGTIQPAVMVLNSPV